MNVSLMASVFSYESSMQRIRPTLVNSRTFYGTRLLFARRVISYKRNVMTIWNFSPKEHGRIGFNSFVDFIATHCDTEKQEREVLESFRAFDRDNKGHASSADIREVLLGVMDKCSEEDKQQILRVFHLDIDRQVTLEGNFCHKIHFPTIS